MFYYYSGITKPPDWKLTAIGKTACLIGHSREEGHVMLRGATQGSTRTRQEAEGEGAARARAFTVASMGRNM